MMSNDEVNDYFSANFDDLSATAANIHEYLRGKGEADDLMQEGYLHLVEKMDKLTPENIKGMFVNFCRTQLIWNNSKHNITASLNKTVPQLKYEEEIKYNSGTAENNTLEKVMIEKWYTERKVAIAVYRSQKKHNKFLIDLYMETNGSNQEMASRLMISRSSVSSLTKKMKSEIQQILKEL